MGFIRKLLHFITFGIVESDQQFYERKKRKETESKRKNTPCYFDDELSFDDFARIATKTAKPFKRLSIEVDNHYVNGRVRTSSGANYWDFCLDFNDFGKVTGKCWVLNRDNKDSSIPLAYANELSKAIKRFRSQQRDCHVKKEDIYCPNCKADLEKQTGFSKDLFSFTCKSCGHKFMNPNIYSGERFKDVYWYCDSCNALLNVQKGFNDRNGFWHCAECGFKNILSQDNIDG